MVDFKALAERAVTVQVAGEDVHLRPPALSIQLAIKRFLDVDKDDKSEQGRAYLRLAAEACHTCVVTEDDISIDQWERIISTPPDLAPTGLKELVDAALHLCGMKVDIPEGAQDHVAEADEALGNSATK